MLTAENMNLKCRLCLCSVGNQIEFCGSLTDNGFCEMVKTVFHFPLPMVQTISGSNYNLPVTVCPQCYTTIRNFYSFTKLTEANQEKLQTEYGNKATSLSQDSVVNATDVNHDDVPPLLMWVDAAVESNHGSNLVTRNTSNENGSHSRSSVNQATPDDTGEIPSAECAIKVNATKQLTKVERRVSLVTAKIDMLIQSIGKTRVESIYNRFHRLSFEFNATETEDELISLNNQLEEKQYKEKVLGWLATNITTVDSANRMNEALDLIFTRKFFDECNWTGKSSIRGQQKVAISKYTNVLELFRLIGTTKDNSVNSSDLKLFFMGKLQRSKSRLHLNGIRRTYSRKKI
ncbi:uncharacterized protein LOC131263204 [Anopheles coustani]|uniref:uncharacterized protein LOC131263204 n=1 Tax=Anopheles coustani TaxID=139045 RepID=UPI002658A00F|nr:uncharacterized protein LOC131263204 [Anopheles coustani]